MLSLVKIIVIYREYILFDLFLFVDNNSSDVIRTLEDKE